MPPPARYNTGYNVGVGGAVVHDGRLLLVRRASRRGRGNWQVPGGFIEPDETVEQAVLREVAEEAGATNEALLRLAKEYEERARIALRVLTGIAVVPGMELHNAGI